MISILIAIVCAVLYFSGDTGERRTYGFYAIVWLILGGSGLMAGQKDDLVITNGNRIITLFPTTPHEKQVLEFSIMLIKKAREKERTADRF